MSKRPKVPEALHGYPTLYKLIWLYVEPEEGEIRVEEMAQDLDVSFAKATTALRHMADTGAVIEVRRRAGPIAGIYRVPRGAELKRVKPYESLRKARADA